MNVKLFLTTIGLSMLMIGCSSQPKVVIQEKIKYVPQVEVKYVSIDINKFAGCPKIKTVKQIFKNKPFSEVTDTELAAAFGYAFNLARECQIKIESYEKEQLRQQELFNATVQ